MRDCLECVWSFCVDKGTKSAVRAQAPEIPCACAVLWDNRSDRSGKSEGEGGESSAKGASCLRQTGILCTRFARSWVRSPVSLSMQALQYGVAAALMGEHRP